MHKNYIVNISKYIYYNIQYCVIVWYGVRISAITIATTNLLFNTYYFQFGVLSSL